MTKAKQTKPSRRRLDPKERRRELLDALAEELIEGGFFGRSVPRVVKRASASQGLFYRYFSDLDEALIALFEERITPSLWEASTRLRFDVESSVEIEKNLISWFENLANLIEQYGPLLQVILIAAPNGTGKAADYSRNLIEQFRAWGEGLLTEVNGKQPYRQMDSELVSHMVIGMTTNSVMYGLGGRTPKDWAREMAKFELWGLLKRPEDGEKNG